MSSKGAIKKTTEARNQIKSQALQKVKASTLNQNITEANTKPEEKKKEKKKAPIINYIDLKTSDNRKVKTEVLINKHILPDKNVIKVKQSNENTMSKSKLNFEGSLNSLVNLNRKILSRKKFEKSTKCNITEINNSYIQKNTKKKVETQRSEKIGTSFIYISKNATSKLSYIKLSDKKNLEKSVSKNSKKSISRHSSTERRRSRTLSPSEVKVLHTKNNKTKSKNFVSFEKEKAVINIEDNTNNKYNYDYDFEDYESDFEEYSSTSQVSEASNSSTPSIDLEPIELCTQEKKTLISSADVHKVEEERMLDSGHFELTEAKKRAAMVEMLMANHLKAPINPEFKETNNQSYREEKQSENKSLPSSTDEGFEDARSGDFVKSLPIPQISLIGVKNLKLEKLFKEPSKKVYSRGQTLMKMIKLDTIECSLYELNPISYDEFIQSYGKLNTQQISTQTNEDNVDVEIQTDKNEFENKWMQFPVKCRSKLETIEDIRLFKMEHIGTGGDKPNHIKLISELYDVLKLNEFLNKAGKLMLALLEEREFGGNILQNETHEIPFSEGFIKLSVSSLSFLCGRQVTMLHYSEINSKILMSIHSAINKNIDLLNKEDYIKNCCIGCVWNVNEPSRPLKLFYSQNLITACCFHCTNNNIIFAGLQDGSICLWNLREEEMYHQIIIDKINELSWIIRSPTYTTAGNWEIKTHTSSIVSIRILSKTEKDEMENSNDTFVSIQICSLDENGHLIIWSVLRNFNLTSDDNGLTQWGKVKLVKSQEVPLFIKKNESNNIKKEFIDMNIDNIDRNNLYLATNDTNILYVNCMGAKNNIPYYEINETDSCGNTTCIEVCPFKQSYFLAGCKDGSIRLHSINIETPILKLKEENYPAEIKCIQWSKTKPLIIYVLDNYSRIIMWDLSNSDIHPAYTIFTKSWGYVKCMSLSPCHTNRDMLKQFLALGTDTGNIEIHKLKKNFYSSQQDDFFKEMKTFLKYVSIL